MQYIVKPTRTRQEHAVIRCDDKGNRIETVAYCETYVDAVYLKHVLEHASDLAHYCARIEATAAADKRNAA